jgi:voltage-gated potassium channel
MYYALTSLSTIGFGDYYPKTDAERLYVSFMLLFGVAIFSFIMGEIRFMISSFTGFDQDLE